jgi:phosphatidylserine decarboxylase
MMKWFFIEKKWWLIGIVVSLFFFIAIPFFFTLLWLLLVIIFLVLFRRTRVNYKDSMTHTSEILLSPVAGRVVDIVYQQVNPLISGEYCHQVKIATPLIGPYGLYLPFSCQINSFEHQQGKKVWRWKRILENLSVIRNKSILVENKKGNSMSIQLLRCPIGFDAQVWVRPGDIGRSSACIGFFPLGGSTLLSLPTNGDILVKIGDKVKPGETVIAGLKGA